MYFFVYQTTNLLNGKVYVGVHRTININDGYLGSGKRMLYAIKKYGRQNFIREILYLAVSKEDAEYQERLIVNPVFLIRNDVYNLAIGGKNCEPYPRTEEQKIQARENLRKAAAKHLDLLKNNQEYRVSYVNKASRAQKLKIQIHGNSFKGKKHTAESKAKVGAKSRIHQKGTGNSSYGKIFMHNLELGINAKIRSEEIASYIILGWIKGRKNFSRLVQR